MASGKSAFTAGLVPPSGMSPIFCLRSCLVFGTGIRSWSASASSPVTDETGHAAPTDQVLVLFTAVTGEVEGEHALVIRGAFEHFPDGGGCEGFVIAVWTRSTILNFSTACASSSSIGSLKRDVTPN